MQRQEASEQRLTIRTGFAAAALAVAAILVGCGGSDDDGSTQAATAEDVVNGCREVEAPQPKQASFKAPKQVLEPGEKATAVVATSCGTFEIALDTKRAPKTANSFAFLSEEGFYDDLTFHRIVPEFVIQGGDPLGNGSGGPGYSVVEKPPANLAYTKGIVAMAKTGTEPPGTSGSQFFVVTAADAGLPPEYALAGKVTKGLDVVARIEGLATPTEQPSQTVLIEDVKVEKG